MPLQIVLTMNCLLLLLTFLRDLSKIQGCFQSLYLSKKEIHISSISPLSIILWRVMKVTYLTTWIGRTHWINSPHVVNWNQTCNSIILIELLVCYIRDIFYMGPIFIPLRKGMWSLEVLLYLWVYIPRIVYLMCKLSMDVLAL